MMDVIVSVVDLVRVNLRINVVKIMDIIIGKWEMVITETD